MPIFVQTLVITSVFILVISVISIMISNYKSYIKTNAIKEATRDALLRAAKVARDRGDFELYDSEGRSGQRLERARIAHDIALEIWKLID